MDPSSLPSDPLVALGPAVFLNICEYLSYLPLGRLPSVSRSWRDFSRANQSAIWRSASYRFSVDPEKIAELRELERDAHATSVEGEADGPPVDWKEVCMERVVPHVNWARGDFQNFFAIREVHSRVKRYAVDEEDETCVVWSTEGGIRVIDTETGRTLFQMPNLCPGVGAEFCGGFLAIVAWGGDFRFRIFRTRHAIARSDCSWAAATDLVDEAHGSQFLSDPDWRPESVIRPDNLDNAADQRGPPPIGRGCMAYYREIMMPTYTQTRRMKVMGEGSGREKVIMGVVGEKQIFFWDVDGADEPPEVHDIPKKIIGISHLDFDEDYIYLCANEQMHILSRSTRRSVLSFPPNPMMNHTICAAAYSVDAIAGEDGPQGIVDMTVESTEPPINHTLNDSTSEQLRYQGHNRGSEGYKDVMKELRECLNISRREAKRCLSRYGDQYYGLQMFLCCHRAGRDLIYAHKDGFLYITRDFASILDIRSSKDRVRKWGQQTVLLRISPCIQSLSVYGTRVAMGTKRNVIFFDTGTLPSLPLPALASRPTSGDAPPIRIRKVLRIKTHIEEIMADPQIYSTAMYVQYYASDKLGVGRCVRGLDFGAGEIKKGQRDRVVGRPDARWSIYV